MRPLTFRLRLLLLKLADEEDRRAAAEDRRRRLRRRCLLSGEWKRNVDAFQLPEAEFMMTFRLGKETVKLLVLDLLPFLPKTRRSDGIPATLKVLITLAFYATGSYQTLVGQSALYNVSQTTVSRAVKQVTEAINKPSVLKKYIKWPMESKEKQHIMARFSRFGIPGVLGCIDGTHVPILKPYAHAEDYFNRMGYHSLNVMIICDSDLNIMCVDSSSPGSTHDSSVWQNHPLCQHLLEINDNGEQVFLLGDNGYPLRQIMMTPILNTVEGSPQRYFNELHATAHNVVVCCMEELKARFRCLSAERALHYSPATAAAIVRACAALHNLARRGAAPAAPRPPTERAADRRRQSQIEEQLWGEVESSMEAPGAAGRLISADFLAGRALRAALVDTLWPERTAFTYELE